MTDFTLGPINKAINHYLTLNHHRFHMPGHAGHTSFTSAGVTPAFYQADLTELDGLDVLSEPESCIADSQQMAADIFGVARSFYLINGSTVGILAALLSCFQPGDTVLIPRNAHRAVLSGLMLADLIPAWFLPSCDDTFGLWGEVTLAQLEAAYNQHPTAKGVVLTSPTYEGIGSDIKAISEFCNTNQLKLIVDEAHGSLWPFSNRLPVSACQWGADVVIQSIHKGIGSATQTAVAHLPKGSSIDAASFQQVLNTLQTTSPSYPLLASLEAAILFANSDEGRQQLDSVLSLSQQFRTRIQENLKSFKLYESDSVYWDSSQLFLQNIYQTGEDWAIPLEEDFKISFESVQTFGALYKVGLGLQQSDFEAFYNALKTWDEKLLAKNPKPYIYPKTSAHYLPVSPQIKMTPREAFFSAGERIEKKQAIGRIAKETIVHCPPGIPILYHGEMINEAVMDYLPNRISVVQ